MQWFVKHPSGSYFGRYTGEANAEWVLIDYVDVVVHIFQTRLRAHYDLEGLWGDAKIINLETNY